MSSRVLPLRSYVLVFAALVVLTVLTTWVAEIDFGMLNMVVAMTIAVAKALLVVLFFMHLLHSPKLIWLFAGAALVWFVILVALTMADIDTRERTPGWQAPAATATPSAEKR